MEAERIIKIELYTDVGGYYSKGMHPLLNYTAIAYNDIFHIVSQINEFNLVCTGRHLSTADTPVYYIDIYYDDDTVQEYCIIYYGPYFPFCDETNGEKYELNHEDLYDFIDYVIDLETQKSNLSICTLVVNPEPTGTD